MTVSFDQLLKLSEVDKEQVKKYRELLPISSHKIRGNFLAVFGRQFKPNPWNTCLKPMWGGFYIKYNDLEMMVDPGVNILTRAENLGVNLARTNVLYVSHAHIDHKNDSNVVLEMSSYRKSPQTRLLISQKSLQDVAVSTHHAEVAEIILLDGAHKIGLPGKVSLNPVGPIIHSIDGAYGFVLNLRGLTIGYTADTGFYKSFLTNEGELDIRNLKDFNGDITGPGKFNLTLSNQFGDVDILVFNLHSVTFRKNSKHNLFHSTVDNAIQVLRNSKVKLCVLDHFNPHGPTGDQFPKLVAEYIEQESGKRVVMTRLQGLSLGLDEFISKK